MILTVVVLVSVSVVIIAAVALPHLREERAQLLTPRGEELLREARNRITSSGRS